MSLVPSEKGVSLYASPSDQKHFLMMCQWMTGIGFYLVLLPCVFVMTGDQSSEALRVAVAIGIGFGQLTMTAIWLTLGLSSIRIVFGFVAVTLEIMAVLFFTTFTVKGMPASFALVLGVACAVHFLTAIGITVILSSVMKGSVLSSNTKVPALVVNQQYRIRDLLVVMFLVAIVAGTIKSMSINFELTPQPIAIFALIICFYGLLSWPAILACVSPRWKTWGTIGLFSSIAVFLAQQAVFSAAIGSIASEPLLFFFCLDAPFVLSVVIHLLIARRFVYLRRVAEKQLW